jgi:type IV pilus assembly protein PilA
MVPFMLIIAAIAIPNLLRARMAANEASAVGTLRTYNTAMVAYATECPKIGYPKDLRSLGPGLLETDKCAHADLVDAQLGTALPVKYGYHFLYTPQVDADGLVTRYVLAADPVTPETSGVRHFFTDESGVIRYNTRGGADVNSEPLM